MYKLIFYTPKDEAEKVKEAIFATGAGSIGNYAKCSWQTEGIGQFLPLAGSKPTLGTQGEIEQVAELRVEILCTENNIRAAIAAMKEAHSYEEVAYEVLSIENF